MTTMTAIKRVETVLRGGIPGGPVSNIRWLSCGQSASPSWRPFLVGREDVVELDPARLHGYIVDADYPPSDFLPTD